MSLDPSKRADKRRRISPLTKTTGADITPGKDLVSVDDLQVSHVVSNSTPPKEGTDSGENGKQWTEYSLIPSKLTKTVEEAEQLAAEDDFKESDLGEVKYALVLYLYGTGYFDALDDDDEARKTQIKKYFKYPGRVSRLKHVALSPMADTVPQDNKAFESYFDFVTICGCVFGKDESKGGFPGNPYLRLQRSSNCYIAASAMFVSLCMQRQDRNQKPLDVGWVARRHVTNTKERLKQRVIENIGGNSKALVKNIIGGEFAESAMESFKLNRQGSDHRREEKLKESKQEIEIYLSEGRHGLVGLWEVPTKWRDIGKQNAGNGLGIWKFTGNSIDSEGSFVTFNSVYDQKKRDKLWTLWQDEIQSVQKLDGESNLGFNSNAGIAQEEDEGDQESITEKHNDNSKASKHAMVLLGSTKMDGDTLFVLLNTWKKMPLILVSFDYMVACKCKITFLNQNLPENFFEGKRECGLLAAECSHPDYVEEGCYIEGEHDYEILEGSS